MIEAHPSPFSLSREEEALGGTDNFWPPPDGDLCAQKVSALSSFFPPAQWKEERGKSRHAGMVRLTLLFPLPRSNEEDRSRTPSPTRAPGTQVG